VESNWQKIASLASEMSASTKRAVGSANEKVTQAKESLSATSDLVFDRVTDITANATASSVEFAENAKNLTHQMVSSVWKSDKSQKELSTQVDSVPITTSIDGEGETSSPIEDIEAALNKLQGGDRVGHAGQAILTAAGGASGVVASGAIASAAGASTLLGSTTLAGTLGGVFVTVTPVGWVVGAAIAGGAAAYGVSKLVRSGGSQDRLRQEIIERLLKRLATLRTKASLQATTKQLQHSIAQALENGHLSNDKAERMRSLVEKGKLDPELALTRVRSLSKES